MSAWNRQVYDLAHRLDCTNCGAQSHRPCRDQTRHNMADELGYSDTHPHRFCVERQKRAIQIILTKRDKVTALVGGVS